VPSGILFCHLGFYLSSWILFVILSEAKDLLGCPRMRADRAGLSLVMGGQRGCKHFDPMTYTADAIG
jgi:hypothetical protein